MPEKKPALEGTSAPPVRLVTGSLQPARAAEPAPEATDPARDTVLRARAGDLGAFRTLVAMFEDRVMRVMVSVLRCDRAMAEDLTQEVFLRVHRGLPRFDGDVRFVAWLHTIASNVAISEYRRRKAQKRDGRTVSLDQPVAGTDDLYLAPAGREQDPGRLAQQQEFLAKVRAAVQQLPEDFRLCVVLRDMEQLSYEEIAEALELPVGTVRSRIHRGRLLLQQALAEFRP